MIQRFNENSPWSTGTLEIIKQFVPGNVLFLERGDLDCADWKQQLINIELLVQQKNIQKIVLNG